MQQNWDVERYEARHNYVWKYGASLLEALAPKSGERILDVGCGSGQLTAEIALSGTDVVGIDSNPAMIAQARINFPTLQFRLANATSFEDAQPFDAIFSNAALHWVRPPEAAVAAMAKALKPNGRLVLEMGGKGNIAQVQTGLRKVLGDALVTQRNPWYYPSIGEYATLLEAHEVPVESAALFPRPTRVEGANGLREWLEMFAGVFLDGLSKNDRERVFSEMETLLRPSMEYDGAWHIDYRRLRISARKSS